IKKIIAGTMKWRLALSRSRNRSLAASFSQSTRPASSSAVRSCAGFGPPSGAISVAAPTMGVASCEFFRSSEGIGHLYRGEILKNKQKLGDGRARIYLSSRAAQTARDLAVALHAPKR